MFSQIESVCEKQSYENNLTEDDVYDEEKNQPPRFVTQIVGNETELSEKQSFKFECQVAPVGDPHLVIEWFKDGVPLGYSKTN